MPWKTDGTFERITNSTQENGISLWQQDLAASVKVIAYRHDFHDHDLAAGIQGCLNLDGYNKMRADLNLNGFKVINIPDASGLNDVPRYGQTAGSMTFDAVGPGVLQLLDRDGNEIDQVTIPTGGGNAGTVTSITVGAGLTASQNPIVSIATLDMKLMATPGQSYSGGISGIVIDNYGRVTQVTTGAYANTNLTTTYGPTNCRVNSSTGTDAIIPAATTSIAGLITTGSQIIGGNKQFNGDVAMMSGKVYALDLPLTIPAVEGQVWNDGSILRVVGQGQAYFAIPHLNTDNDWTARQTFDDIAVLDHKSEFGQQSIGIVYRGLVINADGTVFLPQLPTSATGLAVGQVWNDAGTLKIKI